MDPGSTSSHRFPTKLPRWEVYRDLMIRQRRHQWKRRWKVDFASFETFLHFYQVTQLLERREVRLEERGPRLSKGRDGKIYRLAIPVLKSTQNLVISRCSFAGTAKKCTKKRDARAELLFAH